MNLKKRISTKDIEFKYVVNKLYLFVFELLEVNMKKFYIILITCFIFLTLVSSCSRERSYYFKHAKNTDLSNEQVEGIKLDEKMDDNFVNKNGKPVKHMETDEYTYYRIKKNIIAIDKKNNRITRIMYSKKTETSKGIKLDDPIDKAIKVYGDNYYKRVEQGTDIIGYVDQEKGWTLEFWHDNKNILIIRLDVKSME